MTSTQKIFKHQIWHLFSLVFLILVVNLYASSRPVILDGLFWSISTNSWFWLAIATPIIHQVYVWLVWRFELYLRVFSNKFGTKQAFNIYAAGFSFLFISRLITIIFLAISSKNTLNLNPIIAYVFATLITPLVIYLFYSVKKYFTIERAYGIDHFDKNYNEPYVKKGIFKYTDNGMYVFGLMILYLPGLLFLSEAALLVALFNHIYIWVHYYFTERPDMVVIYGDAP
ncbi:MAG: methyltransferase [Thiohalomonadales bacterium]